MAEALMVDEGRFSPICEHNWRLKRALKLTIICSNIHMETNPRIEPSPRLRRVNKAGYFYAPTKKSSMLKMTGQESSYRLKITSQNSKIDIWVESQFNLLQPAGKQRQMRWRNLVAGNGMKSINDDRREPDQPKANHKIWAAWDKLKGQVTKNLFAIICLILKEGRAPCAIPFMPHSYFYKELPIALFFR
ncbi:Hypothetical predicted protein, partial [Olea europaea subsp. europaea]